MSVPSLRFRRWVSPARSQGVALPSTLWQLPPGIASSLVLWMAVDGSLGHGWPGHGVMHRLPMLHRAGHEH